VDFVVNLSASPYTVGKQQLRQTMLQHLATRFNQPLLYANQVGGNDDLIFDGTSLAFSRQGELISRACAFEADLMLVEYDQEKRDWVAIGASPIAPVPETADAEIWSALVLGVRDYARKCGFSKAVIGLSGGVDSALVAAIAVAALGNTNVLGVLMPSPYSSDHSVNDARQLAENLDMPIQLLAIGELMAGYDHTLATLFEGTEFGLAEELVLTNGTRYFLNASSDVVTTTQEVRPGIDTNSVLKGAAIGAGAATILSGVTGRRRITLGKILIGAGVGAAGGAVLGKKREQVIVVNPDRDLTLTLNSRLALR